MKKLSKVLVIIFAMSLMFLTGCGSKEETKVDDSAAKQEEASKNMQSTEKADDTDVIEIEDVIVEEASKGEDIDYLAIHGITLDRIYSWIMDGTEEVHIADGEQVIVDAIKTYGDYAHYDMGYAVADVNEDGIPELVIGQTTQEGTGNMIYAIYTWKDGNFGCNVKDAEYGKILPGKINNAQVFFLAPFSEYEPGMQVYAEGAGGASGDRVENGNGGAVSMGEPQVCAQWVEDVYLEAGTYDVYTADTQDGMSQVVFIAISKVKDFKLLSLSFEGVDANGNVNYATTEIYSQAELKPERQLLVDMSCDSTIPCYGFSYVDENGVTRRFVIEVSGMDGSILMSEF